jgi:hypothetical protein
MYPHGLGTSAEEGLEEPRYSSGVYDMNQTGANLSSLRQLIGDTTTAPNGPTARDERAARRNLKNDTPARNKPKIEGFRLTTKVQSSITPLKSKEAGTAAAEQKFIHWFV